ncbi:MAG: prepilin-type N-terminal cleavage/methylation domain-containing protein [Candidatus Roizmanbacteria bacterium]|nr:prepilin-type N-terminal cleavage/methylation domain-containing protein [Candidatus Roizmanbacteria bacterium]
MNKIKKGFTLIELLIVIALLGALAVALLAALDPLEQIKKGTDTGVRNTVAEIHGAMVRYSSLQGGAMPFDGTMPFTAFGTTPAATQFVSLQKVIDQGELKSDFAALAGKQLNSIFLTGINDSLSGQQIVNICYAPTAKSFKTDLNTKFVYNPIPGGSVTEDPLAGQAAGCPNVNGTNAAGQQCYWCVR